MPDLSTPSCSYSNFKRARGDASQVPAHTPSTIFVPVECPKSSKVPSPVEQVVQEQRQKLLSMELERAEYENFKLRRQLQKMTTDNEVKNSRVQLLQSNLVSSRAREAGAHEQRAFLSPFAS